MIVVTGATGNVGSALVAELAAAGQAVTAIARGATHPLPAERAGVVPLQADVTDATSLVPALVGAKALFVLVPGAGEGVDGPGLMAAAADAGVRRVVLLSSQGAGSRPGSVAYAPFVALERAVRDSGLEWTVLRTGGLASNAFAWAPTVKEQRRVFTPYPDVALPAVDPADIAAVAAAALTEDGHAGRTYVLTGPEPTSPRDRAAAIGTALGEPVDVVELSPDQAREQMTAFMPELVADATLEILGRPTAEEQRVSPDVLDVLGRPAHTFADWAARNADAFR